MAKLEAVVAQHGAGQQTRLEQDLKAVANPQHPNASRGGVGYFTKGRRKSRDGPGAKVIAVGESSRNDYQVVSGQISVTVPAHVRIEARDGLEGVKRVHVAIAARKYDHAGLQAGVSLAPWTLTSNCSMTGLASRRSDMFLCQIRRLVLVGGLNIQLDQLAGAYLGYARIAEVPQARVYGLTLGIDDFGERMDDHGDVIGRSIHSELVRRSRASRYLRDVLLTTSSGSSGGGGSLFQPEASRWSRTNCLS